MDSDMKTTLKIRNRHLFVGDIFLTVLSIIGVYVLRLELVEVFSNYYLSLLWMIALSLLIKPVVYYLFGLYKRMWIYASMRELRLIVAAATTASLILSFIMLSLFYRQIFISFPRSVLIMDWFVSILLIGGSRFSLRMFAEARNRNGLSKDLRIAKNTLIIGAGDAGALVAKELQRNPLLALKPVGFLDDNDEKMNQQIHGIPVIGNLKDLPQVIEHHKIQEVIISIPSAPGKVIRSVTDICRKKSIPFRTMPGMYELLGGKVSVTRLREVEISDLLRREPAQIDDEIVGSIIKNKNVLVTGAGGSIGVELCRQIARWEPAQLILLGHGENSIFESYLEIKQNFPNLSVSASIADIRDFERMKQEVTRSKPHVIFHAAAHKHVPLMENNVEDCILNNVLGTQNVIECCRLFNVEKLVLISTDKAVRPGSVMGASKRVAEMLVLDAARQTKKPYSIVRFGNVLGSRGSVVPLFKRQIARGGPITVTHPKMKRYFMTIPEAVHLVLQAAGMGTGGETYILNMGEQIRIVDLAEDLIKLSGLEPGRDIDIVYTGVREGEKLSEHLWNEGRKLIKTSHPEIFAEEGQDELIDSQLEDAVNDLIKLSFEGKPEEIIQSLNDIIPQAEVRSLRTEDITKIE